ncbi:MAG TPA: hypothetical protein VHD83_05910 [Puia sp.]|nr:hypothetical protein [Puia sp.]
MRINLIYKGSWTFYVALFALLLPVFLLGYHLFQATDGKFSLPHDDAFLQLSTAKTLAFSHIWGISKYNFEAASPSLLYPLVLAVAFFIFGAHIVVAILVNTALGIVLLICIDKWLKRNGIRPLTQLFILLAVILLSPLPLMVMYGMERTLLLLLAFLTVSRLFDEWDQPAFSRRTLIYSALLVATSYEGLLLIVVACVLLIWQHKWSRIFELILWALLPMIIFGFIALSKGAYFFPTPWIIASGAQFSYDWLIGCGIAVMVPLLSRTRAAQRPAQWMVASAGVLIILLFTRNVYAARDLSRSSIGVFRQEYHVGQFIHLYYNKFSIISDDIGILSYVTEGKYLDLTKVNPGLIHLMSLQSFRIAIVSDTYEHSMPEEWTKAVSWNIPGRDPKTIFFFTKEPYAAEYLIARMKEYSYFLPQEITIQYFYIPTKQAE